MQKKLLFIALLAIGFSTKAQLIVNNTQTPAQLVQNVLLGQGVVATNITFNGSAANANVIRDQVGHFLNGATTNIGIDSGVILSTGKGSLAIGPNNAGGSTAATDNPNEGDADLDLLTTNTVRNKAILEFDFIPNGQTLSFDFVFASEEYPEWANSNFNDVFGFFLSGPGIAGPYSNGAINIALIPSTTVPITINNLNNGTANNGPCEYCAYYVNNGTGSTPAVNSTIQYDGFTLVIPATATVQCGQLYHIKLAIANVGDNSLDSAVFLKANSFNSAPIDFPNDYLVSNGFAPCYGSSTQICTGLPNTVPHIWTLDGDVIPGETSPCLTVTQPGEYCATAFPYGPACPVSDCLIVEFQDPIAIGPPNTLTSCDTLFNLTQNAAVITNGLDVTLSYYTSQSNAEQLLNPITNPSTYTGFDGQTIYVAVEDNTTGCLTSTQFNLDIIICSTDPIPTPPPSLALCESSFGSNSATFNFIPQTPIVLGTAYAAADYTVTYHLTQNNATNDVGAIGPANVVGTNGQTIYVRLEENADPTHFGTTTFQLIVYPIPTATIAVAPLVVCTNDTATFTFTGTPNAVVTYNVDAAANQTIALNSGGTASIVTSPLTADTTYNLVSIQNPVTTCSQLLSGSATVTVNPLPTATISGTTTICEGGTTTITFNGTPNATVAYTVNAGGAQTIALNAAGSATLTTPALTVDTTYALVSVTAAGTPACSQGQSGTAVVTIIELPTASISGTTSICSGSSTDITFTGTANAVVTYTVNSSGNQTVSLGASGSAIVNTGALTVNTTYSLVSVSLPGSPVCGQNLSGSAVVTVNPIPLITTPADQTYCSGDAVGVNALTSVPAGASFTWTNSNPSIGLAASGSGDIPAFTATNNTAAGITATITLTALLNNCTSTDSFTITVNPLPVPNPVIGDYELCDYNNPGDGVEVFTLSSMDAEIANGQNNVTISYYLTQSDAQNQSSPLPNLYSSTSQQIWVNISNNLTGCDAVSSFNLVVNPLPSAATPEPIFQCSNGSTTQAEFNLTINEGVVTAGNASLVTVSYYNTLADAQNGLAATAIQTPGAYMGTDNETVFIRVEDDATGCYATTTQLLRVTQGPVAITPQALHYCDPNNDGFGVFDLESVSAEIAGGVWPVLGVSITYHETETDALLGANPKSSPYENIDPWTQTIYVRVFYTLTGCANYVQLQLIVDPTPEATQPDDYQLCDYTGQVGYEAFDLTTTVPQILGSINPADVNVTFHTTFAGAQNETATITGVTSYVNATQWTQTVFVRVEFITTGCYDIVELNLIVNPLPNATQPNYPQYTLCDNSAPVGYETFDLAAQVDGILLGQQGMSVTFYPSLSQAQAQAAGTSINETNPDLQYTNTLPFVQTLGIVITNTTTGCYSISTMDIRVVPLPSPIPPTEPYTICDENQDGYANFDLNTLLVDILQGANYIITFHETQDDAELGNNDIDITQLYENIDPFTQTLYVRAEDPATGCVTVMPIILNVNPSPIAPIDLDDIVVCDDDNNDQNAQTRVDLTVRTPDVLAQQPLAASNYTVSYHVSLANAQDDVPIIPANDYYASTTQTIWVRVEDNTTGCFNIGTFDIIINIPLALTTPTPLSLCDDDANPNDQHHSFDLTVRNPMITQNLPGYTVTYYPSYALAQAGNPATAIATPTAYTNVPPAVQTLGVVVTSEAGCQSITTLDIRVLPIPVPNTNPPSLGAKCDDNNPGDMMEVFNLTVNAAYILNGDPNLTLHYYHSEADALVPQNEILNPTNALVGDIDPTQQSVWIRVENNRVDYLGNHCFVLVEQPLTVNPLPTVIQPLAPYRVCDDDTDGFAEFDMTSPDLAIAILGPNQNPADFTISYYLTAAAANPFTNTGQAALPNTYTNISNPQDIYIRVVNNATGCVNATGVLTLAVEDYATATGPQSFSSCDDYNDPYDGVFQLDLTQYESDILNGQDPAIFLVSYYHSQSDAEQGINAIPLAEAQAYITQPDTDQIWVKVENSSNTITPFCYALTTIDIEIERYPNPIITTPDGVTTICVDFTTGVVVRPLVLDSNIPNPADYTFEWYEDGALIAGATGSTYTVNTASPTGATRNYTVRVISNSPLLCETTSAGFDVIQSGQASIPAGTTGYTVTNAFTDSQIITVTVEGWGTYEYSLDDGPRQASNIFEGVSLGSHTIHVWDTEGGIAFSCEELIIEEVQVIDYPHYFTPNGDGFHDTWNVVGLGNFDTVTKIYIFDRYGKLLKQLSSSGDGWDGTYNGKPLPSTDYWFTVDYPEQNSMKQFKAHFSLKR